MNVAKARDPCPVGFGELVERDCSVFVRITTAGKGLASIAGLLAGRDWRENVVPWLPEHWNCASHPEIGWPGRCSRSYDAPGIKRTTSRHHVNATNARIPCLVRLGGPSRGAALSFSRKIALRGKVWLVGLSRFPAATTSGARHRTMARRWRAEPRPGSRSWGMKPWQISRCSLFPICLAGDVIAIGSRLIMKYARALVVHGRSSTRECAKRYARSRHVGPPRGKVLTLLGARQS